MIYHLFWLDAFWGIFPFFQGLTCVILLTLSESTMKQTDVSNWASAWPLMVIENQHMVFVSLVFNPKKFCYIKENNQYWLQSTDQSCHRFEHLEVHRYVKSYANKDSCAAMLHCCFAASEMAFSESSQPPLLHCIATSLQSHIKWQSELKQYNSRCFVALLQYYIRCQSELKADPATSLLCYNLCQPEHNTSLAASLLRCNLI